MFVLAFNIRARIPSSTENHDGMPQIPWWLKCAWRWWRNVMQGKAEWDLQHLYTLSTAAADVLCTIPRLDLSLCYFYVIFFLCFASRRETIYSVWGAHEEKSEILFKFVFRLLSLPRSILKWDLPFFFLGISISFLLTLNHRSLHYISLLLPFSL